MITIWYIGAIILFYLDLRHITGVPAHYKPLVIVLGIGLCRRVCPSPMDRIARCSVSSNITSFSWQASFLPVQIAIPSNWLSDKQALPKLALALLATVIFSLTLDLALHITALHFWCGVFLSSTWVVVLFALAAKVKVPFLVKFAGIISICVLFCLFASTVRFGHVLARHLFSGRRTDLIFFRLFPASIFVFILSYYLQYGYDRLLAAFRRNG
ncbi:MAG: hypothetical protein MZU91_01435 [Desulfosudis oleivorans]|nr:hypothetical protein [Desulfosudis oleivorans]